MWLLTHVIHNACCGDAVTGDLRQGHIPKPRAVVTRRWTTRFRTVPHRNMIQISTIPA
jgi:hypothetical protein